MADPARTGRARLATFALILVGLGVTAYAVGNAVGGDSAASHDHSSTDTSGSHDHSSHEHITSKPVAPSDESNGYRIESPGASTFRLVDDDGAPVTAYAEAHGALLHVIVVRPDLSDFRHLHPTIAPDGSWVLEAPDDGEWHAVFESVPADSTDAVVVTTRLGAVDDASPRPLPAPRDRESVATGDGSLLNVTIVRSLVGVDTALSFSITRPDGSTPDGLEAYLGQAAHLVAFDVDDLSYLHIHPTSAVGQNLITFSGALPAGGTYRLFLQFGHRGEVVTVPFTLYT